jgi:hypothetical protein
MATKESYEAARVARKAERDALIAKKSQSEEDEKKIIAWASTCWTVS